MSAMDTLANPIRQRMHAGGGVRRGDEGRQRRQGMVRGRRLGLEDVEASAE